VLALLPQSAREPGSFPASDDCVEFACSPHVCMVFLRVLLFPPTVQGVRVGWISHGELSRNVRGSSRVNMWGYGDRARVRSLSMQALWTEWPLSTL